MREYRTTKNKMTKTSNKLIWDIGLYLDETGKILPKRVSGLSSKQQRYVTKLIKRTRHTYLLNKL